MLRSSREPSAQLREGVLERLRQHARVAGDRHEVVVGRPARDDVQVDVVGEAGAGDLTLVDAEVEAVGVVGLAQRADP